MIDWVALVDWFLWILGVAPFACQAISNSCLPAGCRCYTNAIQPNKLNQLINQITTFGAWLK